MDSRLDSSVNSSVNSRPTREVNRAPDDRRSAFLLWLIWILWLPLFIPSLVALAQSSPSPLRLTISILGAAVFFALYLWMSWQSARALAAHTPRVFPDGVALWAPVVGLVGLSIGLTLMDGYSWGALLIYASSGVSGWLPARKAAAIVAGLVLFIALALGVQGQFAEAISPIVFVGIVGAIVIAFGWSVASSQQLRLIREEMQRAAAVSEERLRIARDLHDLLGHNLSLIALKSELAHRLIAVAPERAAMEIEDIERVARMALQEVREAVTNYRTPTLASELQKAPEALAAAGIGCRIEGDERALNSLSAPVEAVLSWAVREGITNVIRHSRARQCVIRLEREPAGVRVEVSDDGVGAAGAADRGASGNTPGNGLRGLAERVEALGGSVEAGAQAGGGFRLAVWVPAPSPSSVGAKSPGDDAYPAQDETRHAITYHEGDVAR